MTSHVYTNPFHLPVVWPKIKADVIGCINKGGLGLHKPDEVYQKILRGTWHLWLIYHHEHRGRILGFTILDLEENEFIVIVYGFIRPWVERDISDEVKDFVLADIEGMAKSLNMKTIVGYSTRKGMGGILSKERGYDPKMTVYVKKLREHEITQEDSSDRHRDDRSESIQEGRSCNR